VVESEARIIRSRNVAEERVARLNLADNLEFSSPPGILTRIVNFLVLNSANVDERRAAEGTVPPVPRSPEFARAVTTVMANTTVENDSKSYLITISSRSSSPRNAATLANVLVQKYLRERHVQTLSATVARLQSELAKLGCGSATSIQHSWPRKRISPRSKIGSEHRTPRPSTLCP
jgi:uncharacterized protein involved in exopolysaccharide biosynthesis